MKEERIRIYQLFVRLFGNTDETRQFDATRQENGCGRFVDITSTVLEELQKMGFTHIWLLGVLDHATSTRYPGHPANDSSLLKGKAGSPFAVRDFFAVCPDLATTPDKGIDEFKRLVGRIHRCGLKVLIDLVPNHVSRAYQSRTRPDFQLGKDDDPSAFFKRNNSFYYLDRTGGPLQLTNLKEDKSHVLHDQEKEHGRVTGNNAQTWSPSPNDWYETVKLNYGYDFNRRQDSQFLPGPAARYESVPRTWQIMDEVFAHWQGLGIDGFRVDMAHMVPLPFWRWSIRRARLRNGNFFLLGEAYSGDRLSATEGDIITQLYETGFDSIYDDQLYTLLEEIYSGKKWANDIDTKLPSDQMTRFAENHDKVRLASGSHWGGFGMKVGRPVASILYGLSKGPILVYNGQEVGEAGEGKEGWSGEDGRTSIFDYWCQPALVQWMQDRLSPEQTKLRDWYASLIHLCGDAAFFRGGHFGLNDANKANPRYGRLGESRCSGHWIYSYLRYDPDSGQRFLVVVNLSGCSTMKEVNLLCPQEALAWLDLGHEALRFKERLTDGRSIQGVGRELSETGLIVGDLPPCSSLFFEITESLEA